MAVHYDLAIVGGGVNGAAIARLAAFNNLKCLLVEKSDFGGATSSSSSKMAHGGIRYLETFDFGLVREAVLERFELLKTCPHIVKEQRINYPILKENKNSKLKIALGMKLYELLAFPKNLKKSTILSAKELIEREHAFTGTPSKGGFEYSDCMLDDCRMVLENVVDAVHLGADVKNHTTLRNLTPVQGGYTFSTSDHLNGDEIECFAKQIIYTVGPWADLEWRKGQQTKDMLHLSQGTHLYVKELPIKGTFILPVPDTSRYFFILPFHQGHLIGTTERDISEDELDLLTAKEDEIEELLNPLKYYFPDIKPSIVCTTVGVRPLARSKNSKNASTLSRKHEFYKNKQGVWYGVGGKLTTHRVFAHELLEKVFQKKLNPVLGRNFPGAQNWDGGRDVMVQGRALGIQASIVKRWVDVYGSRSVEILKLYESIGNPDFPEIAEAIFCKEFELCRTKLDFIRGRSRLFFEEEMSIELFESLAGIFPECTQTKDDFVQFLEVNNHMALSKIKQKCLSPFYSQN